MVRFLLENGANPEQADFAGLYVLSPYLAARSADTAARSARDYAFLSARNPSVTSVVKEELCTLLNPEEVLSNQEFTMIHRIVLGYSTHSLAAELEEQPHLIDVTDGFGRTPLHWAVYCKKEWAVCTLLEYDADISIPDAEGETIFGHMYLHSSLNETITCHLVVAVSDLIHADYRATAFINRQDVGKRTPWQEAISRGHASLVRAFLNIGCDLSLRNFWGETVFHLAALSTDVDVILAVAQTDLTCVELRVRDVHGMTGAECIRARMEGREMPHWSRRGLEYHAGRCGAEAKAEAEALLRLLTQAVSYDKGVLEDFCKSEDVAQALGGVFGRCGVDVQQWTRNRVYEHPLTEEGVESDACCIYHDAPGDATVPVITKL